jgi:hypothetical protein
MTVGSCIGVKDWNNVGVVWNKKHIAAYNKIEVGDVLTTKYNIPYKSELSYGVKRDVRSPRQVKVLEKEVLNNTVCFKLELVDDKLPADSQDFLTYNPKKGEKIKTVINIKSHTGYLFERPGEYVLANKQKPYKLHPVVVADIRRRNNENHEKKSSEIKYVDNSFLKWNLFGAEK